MSSDSTKRFSKVVDHYVKYRPDYPIQLVYFLKRYQLIDRQFTIADIGSGTGKSSLLFLPHVKKLYGIEPNPEMREAAEKLLHKKNNFESLDGTAENTGLEDSSVDMVVAGQSFHWFDVQKAKKEFKRILKVNRPVLILWNKRDDNASAFMMAYNDFLNMFSTDYREVNLRRVNVKILNSFFEDGFEHTNFPNEQIFDLEGLKGRYLSSSYSFNEDHPHHADAMTALEALFEKYEYKGEVIMNYQTEVFYGAFNQKFIPVWKKTVFHLLRIPAFFAYIFIITGLFFASLFKKLKKKLSEK